MITGSSGAWARVGGLMKILLNPNRLLYEEEESTELWKQMKQQ